MIKLSKNDVGQKFRTAKGEVLTLMKWRDDDPDFPARLGEDYRNYNANGRRFRHNVDRDTLVARVEEKPACLKTRLRTREIGRKFKTVDGATVTLTDAPGVPPGEEGWRVEGERHGLTQCYRVAASGRLVDRCGAWNHDVEDSWLNLVERLPVEKKPKPDPFMGFKVGDKVDFLDSKGREYKGWGAAVVTKLVNAYCGPSLEGRSKYGCIGLNEVKQCRRAVEPNRRPYPDYKRMKAALEDIRDNSPIGSDAALKAKAGLEGVEC